MLRPLSLLALSLAACGSPPATDDAATLPGHDAAPSTVDAFGAIDTGPAPDTGPGMPGHDAGPAPIDPCVHEGTCAPGTWVNVTPTGVSLTEGSCGNFGTTSVGVSPTNPAELFAEINCQGIFHSTDYGQTWNGPINTGTHGAEVGDCAGSISVANHATDGGTTIYEACIRGSGLGFWRSQNGGVDWTKYAITPTPDRQDYYAPAIDPYDTNHLIMAGHEMDALVESTDGGQTWTAIHIETGMHQSGGTAALFFVDRGNASGTRTSFLWLAQGSGGGIGTWRTENGGTSWTQVDSNEHGHGNSQIYQPDTTGTLYMAGVYSALGWGVLRSGDYGATWTHVGTTGNQSNVWGVGSRIYSDWSWAIGGSQTVDPGFQSTDAPGTGTWTSATTPAGMFIGPAQVAVTHDPDHAIFIGACWQAGLWRFIEP